MGHEGVGEVVEVGSKVTSFKVGDKVLSPFNFRLQEGIGSAWGAFAEYGTVFDAKAPGAEVLGKSILELGLKQTLLPEWVDPVDATMLITLRETLGACKRFNIDANESVAVYGMGPVGVSFVKFLSMRGAKPIIALSRSQGKMDLGLEAGADYIINSEDPDRIAKMREIVPGGLDHVLDAVGSTDIFNEAMSLLKEDGQICAYGVPGNTSAVLDWTANPNYNFHLNFYQMTSKVLEYWANNQVLAMVKSGDINLKDYISAYFPFEEILPVMDRFLNKEFPKKVVITF
jgi:threonine dehydrogenase-like Zn-dependent dehydrogenase